MKIHLWGAIGVIGVVVVLMFWNGQHWMTLGIAAVAIYLYIKYVSVHDETSRRG